MGRVILLTPWRKVQLILDTEAYIKWVRNLPRKVIYVPVLVLHREAHMWIGVALLDVPRAALGQNAFAPRGAFTNVSSKGLLNFPENSMAFVSVIAIIYTRGCVVASGTR